ncbi:proline-rich protein 23C-like [Myotis yumanensis]|uniref:proline-rich protein 23C-like n=1 Tax=Myotis yumanensis TaxID=159337 RepID=UPI0038D4CC24
MPGVDSSKGGHEGGVREGGDRRPKNTEQRCSRLLSPSSHAAPQCEPDSGGPGPAKRCRIEEPAGPEDGMAPSLQGLPVPWAADALTSVLVVAEGCALPSVNTVLETQSKPTLVPPVSLVPEARLGSGEGAHSPVGLEPGTLLDDAPTGAITIQQEFCTSTPHIALPIEAPHQDEEVSSWFQPPLMLPAGWLTGTRSGSPLLPHGPIRGPWPPPPRPSPERNAPGPYSNLSFNLWEPFPSSPLQTLPLSPSPSPGPRVRRPWLHALGPAPKAWKCLF